MRNVVSRYLSPSGRNAHLCGVGLPRGRSTEMAVEDAGESECLAVMALIGVQSLPYSERRQTSYAGVAGRQRRGKP